MCKTCHGNSNRKSNKEGRLTKSKEKCREHREKTKELPKCSRPKRSPAKVKKCLTEIEKIMLRIQPPIADRERYLHPEHVNCFLEESDRVYIKKPKCRPCPSEQPKVCVEDKKKKTKKTADGNVEGERDKDQTTDNGRERSAESTAADQKGEEDVKVEEDRESSEHKKASSQAKKNKKKKNKEKRKRKKDIEKDSNSEMSICSNDSEVCLVGLGLTKEDKKNIEENRRKVHPPPDKRSNSAEGNKNGREVSEHSGEDKE